MTTFRPDTSFPYLKIAREYGVDYGEVVRFVESIEATPQFGYRNLDQWERDVVDAWINENNRRRAVSHAPQMDPGPAGMDLS